MFNSLTIAAECAVLLTGDFGYLELLRSQIRVLMDNAITREDGQLLLPARYGPGGWEYALGDPGKRQPAPFRMQELAHLYHISMAAEDYELIARIRETDQGAGLEPRSRRRRKELRRHRTGPLPVLRRAGTPDWPVKILQAEYENARTACESIRNETRDARALIADNYCPPNPVYTKGLTQVTMGAPHSVYTGGLLRATLRYFDPDRARPGLPPGVAALVDRLGSGTAGVHLVNLDAGGTRNLIVQAGAFAEHRFVELTCGDQTIPVESKYFAVPASARCIHPAGHGHAPLRQPAHLRLPLARGEDPGALPVTGGNDACGIRRPVCAGASQFPNGGSGVLKDIRQAIVSRGGREIPAPPVSENP